MSHNYYSEINLHIVWHTKGSSPLLVPKVEAIVHHYIRGRCIAATGVKFYEIGGIETHVHLVLDVAPTVLISELVGQLKGSSSHDVNHKLGNGAKVLDWQSGYGVVSFGRRDLPWVLDYVRRQREHHAAGKVYDRLERYVPIPDTPAVDETDAQSADEGGVWATRPEGRACAPTGKAP